MKRYLSCYHYLIVLPMEDDSQKLFVAGIKKIFFDRKRDLNEKNRKLTWAMIAHEIAESPGNLSGFINFKRNYSETKRKRLAAYFNKNHIEVIDIGRKQIKQADELFEQKLDEEERKEIKDWEDYISGASNIPSSRMVDNAIEIIENAKNYHMTTDELKYKEQFDEISELLSDILDYPLRKFSTQTKISILTDTADQLLREAVEEACVKINRKQEQAVIKIISEELEIAVNSVKKNIIRYLEAFGA